MKVTRDVTFFMSGVSTCSMADAVLSGDVIWAVLFFGLASALWLLGKRDQK